MPVSNEKMKQAADAAWATLSTGVGLAHRDAFEQAFKAGYEQAERDHRVGEFHSKNAVNKL